MSYQYLKLRIVGVSPLLMHNGQLADPMNPIVKQIKAMTSKRNKTDADHQELARLEWHGSLYLHNDEPCLPGEVIEGAFVQGAKKNKRGKQAAAGVVCPNNAPLIYEGPRVPGELWAMPEFRLTVGARIKGARVMRTRPIFRKWAVDVELMYDDLQLNEREVVDTLRTVGEIIGIGDWRPKFGRFVIEE